MPATFQIKCQLKKLVKFCHLPVKIFQKKWNFFRAYENISGLGALLMDWLFQINESKTRPGIIGIIRWKLDEKSKPALWFSLRREYVHITRIPEWIFYYNDYWVKKYWSPGRSNSAISFFYIFRWLVNPNMTIKMLLFFSWQALACRPQCSILGDALPDRSAIDRAARRRPRLAAAC